MLKAVIFDMDGVLFDSEQAIIDCWVPVAQKHGITDVVPQCLKCIGITETESAKVFRSVYGQDFPYEKIRKEVNEAYREFCDQGKLPVKPGVTELLEYLADSGVKIALASSGDRSHVERLLGKAGILRFFSVIVGGDMVTRGKPAPDVFLKALDELNRAGQNPIEKQETLIIEDSHQGIRAAHAAQIPAVMVPDLLPPTEECEQKTLAVFKDLLEVKAFIETQCSIES